MKFKIQHILQGIALEREKRLAKIAETIVEQGRLNEEAAIKAAEQASELKERFVQLAARVEQVGNLYREDLRDLEDDLWKIRGKAPSRYEAERTAQKAKDLQETKEKLEAEHEDASSPLEEFLRIVEEAGNSTVSQYAVDQAGFKGHRLAAYAVSYSQHEKKEN